ncbi:hypothetical protein [Polaribacter cellanae]|uniref:Uncharacterized protein n=1 Tax=Polaribacter cellanae TaxID=2818493 RepID=A0A975CPL8_9FLAO|nr:hypothetical protein [Polaribacter cellanae]QTE23358.1 hypothetical protein J3359_03510 [Polaribacter cellanae]
MFLTTDLNKSFYSLLKSLKKEALKYGGNIVKIKKQSHLESNKLFGGTRHRIKADIFYSKHVSKPKDKIITDKTTLYIYRYRGGFLVNYNLYLNDSLICEINSNIKKTIYLKKKGEYFLRNNKSDEKEIITLHKGQKIYVRCSSGKPFIQIMENKKGKLEFDNFTTN